VLIAVQLAHPAGLVTLKLKPPPPLPGDAPLGLSDELHETPSCVTVKVEPPVTVIVAVREVVFGLAATA
jgi:hypothetical protein